MNDNKLIFVSWNAHFIQLFVCACVCLSVGPLLPSPFYVYVYNVLGNNYDSSEMINKNRILMINRVFILYQ